ncbi:MAG: discoidin domain-containing protein, partial [Thermoguttaceae bacterium]
MRTRFLLLLSAILFVPYYASAEQNVVQVLVTADSENDGFEAYKAMDGNPETMWHTQFSTPPRGTSAFPFPISCGYGFGCNLSHPHQPADARRTGQNNVPPPHSLCIDLQAEYEINGFTYQARKDAANGSIGDYELFITNNENEQCSPVSKGSLKKTDIPQNVKFDKPVKGRFIKFIGLSEVNGLPFTSAAEFTLLSYGNIFVPELSGKSGAASLLKRVERTEADRDLCDEFNILVGEFDKPLYYNAIKDQVQNEQLLILATDRDPVDVIYRRVCALADTHPNAPETNLNSFAEKVQTVPVADTAARFELFKEIAKIRRELMFSNPLLDFKELLFVKKHRATFEHMCDQFYGINSLPGGGLFVLENPFKMNENGKYDQEAAQKRVRNLLENSVVENGRLKGQKLNTGSFVSPDLSYDGKEIVFAYVECEGSTEQAFHTDLTRGHWTPGRSFHIFKCNADGSDLRMLTDGTWNDFDPCFLPNGRVAFISERRGGYLRCGRECPTYTLFDMNPDGSKIRCLSYHETNEWNPSVTNDGKIIWTRWDYVDRFGCIAHHPWVTSLDGRDPRQVHGNYSPRHERADAEYDVRAIPASPKYIATGGPHHGQSYGSVIMIDPQVEDDDSMGPVKRLTPEVGFPESQGGGQVYGTPWALSENLFLVVADFGFQPNGGIPTSSRGEYGIYLCDTFGNRELVYRDPEVGCISPIPFVSR